MGISGLIPFLKNATREAHIREFSGQTAAIDVYGWLHRGTFGCADRLIQGEKTDGYVRYVMKFLQVFLSAGIRPILVFDGRNLPSKSLTESKRRERREINKKMGKEFLRDGRSREALDCFRKAIDITWDMARDVILEARAQGIDVLVAPYEADAQMAFLASIGLADVIISEDSDLVVFGCEKIFFKMDMNGSGKLYEKSLLSKCFGGASNISFEKFRYISIMSGCDYLPSLHGIGLAKSLRFWKSIHNPDVSSVLPKIPSYLRMPQLEVTNDYIAGFIRANETFLYQVVFDPITKKLRHLTQPSEPSVERKFAGEFVESDLAFQMAIGNVNLKSLKVIDNYDPSNPLKIHPNYKSIWSSEPMTVHSKESTQKSGSQLLINTAFAPTASRKRKLESEIAAEPPKKDKVLESPEKNENLSSLYSKDTSPILQTSSINRPFVISKYFAIDSKDRCIDRKLERGRKNGGEWLESIESVVTHEDKFIYTTEEEPKTESPLVSTSPEIKSETSSDKKRNPFVKMEVQSLSSPLRSPLLNIVSPRALKPEITPEKKYSSLINLANEKDNVHKRLFKDDGLESFESRDAPKTPPTILKSPILNGSGPKNGFAAKEESPITPSLIKSKVMPLSSTASNSSSYFKKGNAKPSGLMKPVSSSQKNIFQFYKKVEK